jgi:hypothetical protein
LKKPQVWDKKKKEKNVKKPQEQVEKPDLNEEELKQLEKSRYSHHVLTDNT